MLVYYVLKRNQIKHYCSDIFRSMADSQSYCLRRRNHSSDIIDVFDRMFKDESMTDVTLMCSDGTIKAHRMVLSACSPYFKTVFDKMPNNYNNYYPIVILKDMLINDLKAIIEFIYRGEVTVAQEQLESVIKNGESLQIKGLVDIEDNKDKDSNSGTAITRRRRRRRHRRKSALEENNKNCNNPEDENDEDMNDRINSSDDYISEYSDGDETSHSLVGTPTGVSASKNYNESVGASEGDIEPSRLLEQSMITGDTQESNNIHQYSSSNAHPLSTVDEDIDVKPILYDEPLGLMSQLSSGLTSHSLPHEVHSDSPHNHSIHVSTASSLVTYDTSGIQSIPGTSSLSQTATRSHSSNEPFGQSLHSGHSSSHNADSPQTPHNHLSPLSFQSDGCSSLSSLSISVRRPYHCPICMKSFSEKGNMKRHTQIHLQQRNRYVCDTCGKCFAWKDNFHRHKRSAHTISNTNINFSKETQTQILRNSKEITTF